MTSRRKFVQCASATFVYGAFSRGLTAYAQSLHLPLGIQLYSVREQLAKDYEGTLREVGGLGYREVEAAGFYKKSAVEVGQALQKADLKCVSGHYGSPDLHQQLDQIIEFSKQIGAEYIICSSPGKRDASSKPGAMTLDDWRWNADQFNVIGQKVGAAGLKFGYHNHMHEFAETDGVMPYVELLHRTDPSLVTFELDCGWAVVGGQKPLELLRDHSSRISMLHVKDFKIAAGPAAEGKEHTVTELGMGSIDYRPIFQEAAKAQKIKHIFVEQEAFDMPYIESLKVDRDYVHKLMQ